MAIQKPGQPSLADFLGDKKVEEIDPILIQQENIVLTFPGGSRIELGECASPDGPSPFIRLTSPNEPDQLHSLALWVDPISFQPMCTLRTGPGQYQSYPLDKKLASPYGKDRSP